MRFLCDNLEVVQVVNSQTANSCPLVRLLWHLMMKRLELNAQFTVGRNSIVDSLSRLRFQEFSQGVDIKGIPCPAILPWFSHSYGIGPVVCHVGGL